MLIGVNLILNDATLPMRYVAPQIEAHGLDVLFLGEHTHVPVATVYPRTPDGILPEFYKRFLDPFVQLSVAASLTSTVRIGTGVVLVAERNPLELAKSVASLDLVSNGRLEFGVGYGWNKLEMLNNGIDPAHRRAIFREKLLALRRLWTEETVTFNGDFVSFTESWSFPKPLQTPSPPVLIGAAASRSTFDDVLRLGDGWYPLTSDDLPAEVAQLAEAAGGALPPVTAVEMDGQREGAPWSWENAAAAKKLAANALAYADCGVHCLSIGVPADDTERFNRALDHLASLRELVQ